MRFANAVRPHNGFDDRLVLRLDTAQLSLVQRHNSGRGAMTIPYTVELDKRVHAAIAPIFATDMFLKNGHTNASLNATVTFVKRHDCIFAVTCHHVLEAFRNEALKSGIPLAPSVHFGRTVIQFKSHHGAAIRWTFASCRDFPDRSVLNNANALKAFNVQNASRPDIAIAEVPSETWAMFCKDRPMQPIDLDMWDTPPWGELGRFWAAYGFPDVHKYVAGDKVAAPMPRITVELQSSSPQHREDFILCSPLDREHGFGFSGISGGPVLAESEADQCFYFTGLVFEGTPSTVEPTSTEEAIFGSSDIFLRCYLLTPEAFDRWRSALKYGVELTLCQQTSSL